jgi:microcystin-dependent protein
VPLVIPNDLVNLQPADASELQANFTAIETYINSELIARDGSIAMTNGLLLPGAPTSTNQAATKGYVDATIPVAAIFPFAGPTAPTNYLLCQGQTVSRATYAALFAVIGTTYGVGDGTTTFALPTLAGRMPVGQWSGNTAVDTLGEMGGAYDAVLPTHNHPGVDHLHGVNINTGTESNFHTHPVNIGEVVRLNSFFPTAAIVATANGPHKVDSANTAAMPTSNNSELHTHNVSGNTGAADRALTTGNAGVSATNGNLPPFTVVHYIIKVF